MLGALAGDIAGSRFEFLNRRDKTFQLFTADSRPTDDTVTSLAVAQALMAADGDWERLAGETVRSLKSLGREYPDAGYGSRFREWLFSDRSQPYGSYGNGAAMRVSPVAWVAGSEPEVKRLSRLVTAVTHDHEEGIKGAEAVALSIFLARSGASRESIRQRLNRDYYDLDFSLQELSEGRSASLACQDTVPLAVVSFLEAVSFEDAVRKAISLGGDSDTLAAISGSLAEAVFAIPERIRRATLSFLDDRQRALFLAWEAWLDRRGLAIPRPSSGD